MALTSGTRLGPYEILSPLGAGGMGEVYKARDTRLDRLVAIKILPPQFAGDPQFRERFEREARSISALSHPHICALYDVGHQDDVEYLVLAYLEGQTLASRLESGPLPIIEALRIAIEIAGALDAAHREGIVHRDLKPGNVMLTKAGSKLLDFGLAKVATAGALPGDSATALPTASAPLTAQGTLLGTFQYMAPEQIEGANADARSDIFAFGAVLFEMLTGRRAFQGKGQASLLGSILKDEPPPVSQIQPATPLALDRVIRKCLAKDPDDRWQTAKDLRDELQWIVSAPASAGAAAAGVVSAPARPRPSRWPWMVSALAMVVVLAAIVPAVLYLRQAPPDLPLVRFLIDTPIAPMTPSLAISPNGRMLAYSARDNGTVRLWVRSLDETKAKPIAGTENGLFPFWSPDGKSLGFFADNKLKRIDIAGGQATVLTDVGLARGGTWNRDGVILFTPTVQSGLMSIPASGGPVKAITTVDNRGGSHRWPFFLADGRHFIFYVYQSSAAVEGVYGGSLDGGPIKRIMAAESAAAFVAPDILLAARGASLMAWRFDPSAMAVSGEPIVVAQDIGDSGVQRRAFSASPGVLVHRAGGAQPRQFEWRDRTGKLLGKVGQPDESWMAAPELSPDDTRVAVFHESQGHNNDIWILDLARAGWSRFTSDDASENTPLWSPDGRKILFGSVRTGFVQIFEKPTSGAVDEHQFLTGTHNQMPLSWSGDGRFLLYRDRDPQTGDDLWALPLDGNRTPIPIARTTFQESEGQFSPDGKWIAYTSNETGQLDVYLRRFPQPGTWPLLTAGGSQVRWRPDGKALYFISNDNRLTTIALTLPDGTGEPTIGRPESLFPIQLAYGSNVTGVKPQYAVARDGRLLMNVAVDSGQNEPIVVELNWRTLLNGWK